MPLYFPVLAVETPAKSGTSPNTTHFVFVPKSTVDIPAAGKAVALEETGPTENTAGEKFLDKMQAKCAAVSVDAGGKKWIDGACALTDADGDVVFSTFDTRDLDKAKPKMDCGTHIITGGLCTRASNVQVGVGQREDCQSGGRSALPSSVASSVCRIWLDLIRC